MIYEFIFLNSIINSYLIIIIIPSVHNSFLLLSLSFLLIDSYIQVFTIIIYFSKILLAQFTAPIAKYY